LRTGGADTNQIAVVYDKIQLTYQELNEKANQLGFCKSLGVIPKEFVGILKKRDTKFLDSYPRYIEGGRNLCTH